MLPCGISQVNVNFILKSKKHRTYYFVKIFESSKLSHVFSSFPRCLSRVDCSPVVTRWLHYIKGTWYSAG